VRGTRNGRLIVGIAAIPLVLGALTALPSLAATSAPPTPPAATTATRTAHGRLYTLPTGDHVEVVDGRAHLLPAPGHSGPAVTTNIGGRLTVVPVGAMRTASSLADFQVQGPPPPVQTDFAMSLLKVRALDHEGNPAAVAEVVVVNVDDPKRAAWDGLMASGDARVEVPAGHYGVAVAIFNADAKGNETETDLLSVTDVTVPSGGTTVTLDGRTAQQVSVVTPQPSHTVDVVAGWIRGTATAHVSIDVGAKPGTRFYVGGAAKAKVGVMQFSLVARNVGTGYTYLFCLPKADAIPANQTWTPAASSFAVVDSDYVTDTPGQQLYLWDDFTVPGDPADGSSLPTLDFVKGQAPGHDRRYISAGAAMSYDGLMLPVPNAFLDNELERRAHLLPGQHLSLTWNGGLIVPAPIPFDGGCFLCRKGNTISDAAVMDADASGDIGQWNDGPTKVSEDGKVIHTDTTMGTSFDLTVPAARHRYVWSMDVTHGTSETALSTHSTIAWGFDSAQTATATPVPMLYANAWFTADGHESVSTGPAEFDADLLHQPGAADPAVSTASAAISYDDGATWKPLSTTVSAHHLHGTFTVPAGTKPGYLALRLHAVDAAGSSVDETVQHAALVNAPNGLPLPKAATPPGSPAGTTAVCPTARPGTARCFALRSARTATPKGLARNDFLSAYRLPATGGTGRTVAIVDAHDDPTAEADLAVYRKTFGLPACTTKNGCFTKLNQKGQTAPLPAFDPADDWSVEVALDLDMVSAVCPECHIVLVEANSADSTDLATAELAATASGAVAVSNSWGGDELSDDQKLNANFAHPGVAITASSGDNGFLEASWPASLSTVIAVGGTTLKKSSTAARGWTETAWKGAGSGCSAWIAKPSWQKDTHCGMRTASDISAVADPATGVAVYVQGDWVVVGGTSASSPLIAGMIALAGNASALPNAKYIYSHASKLFDVTSGSNANWDCGGDYLCTAGPGYDGPTGLGSPNGLGAL
jgi:subtilase family protein